MPAKNGPAMGINSWLEDELFQQYQHDRTAVDETWKQLFESGAKPSDDLVASARNPESHQPPSQ